jgi:hypothetical protein
MLDSAKEGDTMSIPVPAETPDPNIDDPELPKPEEPPSPVMPPVIEPPVGDPPSPESPVILNDTFAE